MPRRQEFRRGDEVKLVPASGESATTIVGRYHATREGQYWIEVDGIGAVSVRTAQFSIVRLDPLPTNLYSVVGHPTDPSKMLYVLTGHMWKALAPGVHRVVPGAEVKTALHDGGYKVISEGVEDGSSND